MSDTLGGMKSEDWDRWRKEFEEAIKKQPNPEPVPYYPTPQPCPSCGRCPTCGRSDWHAWPKEWTITYTGNT